MLPEGAKLINQIQVVRSIRLCNIEKEKRNMLAF